MFFRRSQTSTNKVNDHIYIYIEVTYATVLKSIEHLKLQRLSKPVQQDRFLRHSGTKKPYGFTFHCDIGFQKVTITSQHKKKQFVSKFKASPFIQ